MTGQTNYQENLDVGSMAVWQFNACDGEPINITVTKNPSTATLNLWVRLLNWDGSLLKSASGATSASITTPTPGSATCTVVVAQVDFSHSMCGAVRQRQGE